MQKHYVDRNGDFAGTFIGITSPSLIEVSSPAPDQTSRWDFKKEIWVKNTDATSQTEVSSIVVSPWQFRQALNEFGLRQQVEQLVNSTADLNIKDGWQYATEWREDHPLVKQIANQLKVSEETLHMLFLIAKSK